MHSSVPNSKKILTSSRDERRPKSEKSYENTVSFDRGSIGTDAVPFRAEDSPKVHKNPRLTGRSLPLEMRGPSDDFRHRAEQARSAMQTPHDLAVLSFSQVAEIWLEQHRDSISDRTYRDYLFYIRTLNKKFKDTPCAAIHIGHVIAYRRERQQTAGPWCINHEIVTLKQVLELAGLWDLIGKHYKPLKIENTGPPRVMTPEEEERFFRVVSEHPEWKVAYWAVSITNNTSAFGCELRFLQVKHVFLEHVPPKIHIPDGKVKNEFRARVIPLNAEALKQVQRLLDRLKDDFGAGRPDHFLFPFRIKKGEYDVTRPASAFFIRSAFRSMRTVTGLPWLQPRHFRNQIITKLFESGAPDETITSIAGHQAIKMSRYYSRIRIHAKAEALDKIAPQPAVQKRAKGARA